MVDACVIVRVTGTETDRETGVVTETTAQIYAGKCEVKDSGAFTREATPTPDDLTLMRNRTLKLPMVGSEGIEEKDRVTITSCLHDADMVGRVFVVRNDFTASHATARRLGVEEAT